MRTNIRAWWKLCGTLKKINKKFPDWQFVYLLTFVIILNERRQGDVNHRNGSYDRNFTLKGIGEVDIQIPRDRKSDFKTHVIPRGKRYEDTIRQDLCLMF